MVSTMNTSAALEVGLIHQEVGETERREVKGREREVQHKSARFYRGGARNSAAILLT